MNILDAAEMGEYEVGQIVDLVIKDKTDLGYKAVVNGKHWGVLYKDEVFQFLEKNQSLKGYIKKQREDGKLDLTLYPTGIKARADISEAILAQLKEAGGFLPITDKTPPEVIYESFGVSKKKFKMALGGLYKKRLIVISDDGIRAPLGHKK